MGGKFWYSTRIIGRSEKSFMKQITYPKLFQFSLFWYLWAGVFCPIGWHLFDEVQTLEDRSLFCDACGLDIKIKDKNNA
jgi:hypothetical protein